MTVEREGRKRCTPTRSVPASVRFRVPSGDTAPEWRYDTFEHRPETEDAHTGKPKRHRLFTEVLRTVSSGGVSKRKKNFLFAIFQKKRKIIFEKAES